MLRPPELPNTQPGSPRSALPPMVFLFGLAGAGKSYCGELLAARLGYECCNLDEHLTPAMQQAIAEKRSFTEEMRDEFFEVVRDVISQRVKAGKPTIFFQAAYKERHRQMLKAAHPTLEFVCVTAPDDVIEQRLNTRGDWVGPGYAATIARNFEPSAAWRVLLNDGASDDALVERFVGLFGGV